MAKKNVYLASGFSRREKLRELAQALTKKGLSVCSSWIWIEDRPEHSDDKYNEFARKIANTNFIDLHMTDILVIDGDGIGLNSHGGAAVEFGFCLARSKPIYLVGQRISSFHWLEQVTQVHDYDELLEIL